MTVEKDISKVITPTDQNRREKHDEPEFLAIT